MSKKLLPVLFCFSIMYPILAHSQANHRLKSAIHDKEATAPKLDGQWKGYFGSNGDIAATGDLTTEYVLEIEINGADVSGYSYSYFQNRLYYVICSLSGKYDRTAKTISIVEKQLVKDNTPPGWRNCFQTHTLTYKKQGSVEVLSGSWKPAPGQLGDCGFGNTTLTRRTLSNNLASYNKPHITSPPVATNKPTRKTPVPNITSKNSVAKNKPTIPITQPTAPSVTDNSPTVVAAPKLLPAEKNTISETPAVSDIHYEKRINKLLKTIEIKNETFKADFYDNGAIDGDSISVFYNGKLILSHKRLSDTAISIVLKANTGYEANELTMYAENLGEIPPNTALMVVTDGDSRYEVNISSDMQNSGTVRFIHKPK